MENKEHKPVKIKVIGVGGAGNNAINLLLNEHLPNIELWVANTDYQDLELSACTNKIYLKGSTEGYGAGGNPELGKKSAEDSVRDIEEALKNANLAIITAGLGGGTGTGAAPVIAKKAKESGITTLGVVFMPFSELEGVKKLNLAQKGLAEMAKYCDAYVVISNQKLIESYGAVNTSQAFKVANENLKNAIMIISDIVNTNYDINVDFNDLKETLKNGQQTFIGLGKGFGKDAMLKAVENVFKNVLSDKELINPSKLLMVMKVQNSGLNLVNEAKKLISEKFKAQDEQLNICFGFSTITPATSDHDAAFDISLIASGFDGKEKIESPKVEDKLLDNLELENENEEVLQITQSISLIENENQLAAFQTEETDLPQNWDDNEEEEEITVHSNKKPGFFGRLFKK
ncbi:cell division protein FtsZ [Mycoplasmopsis iners]|uniref:cell division protein FtsZ n=1 Tax=Mycoplasmopsis iners TaxID=76630 RepID=UPI00068C8F38|nr:cell division protein FtsZ [Mycoplasmopsis iners]